MGPVHRRQSRPGAGQVEGEAIELFEMESRERFEAGGAVVGEAQPDHAVIGLAAGSLHEAGRLGTVDQADGAVVAQEQVVGDLTHGGAFGVVVAPDGQQQLVLGGSQPGDLGLMGAPAFEVAEPGAQGEQPGVGDVRKRHSYQDNIVSR